MPWSMQVWKDVIKWIFVLMYFKSHVFKLVREIIFEMDCLKQTKLCSGTLNTMSIFLNFCHCPGFHRPCLTLLHRFRCAIVKCAAFISFVEYSSPSRSSQFLPSSVTLTLSRETCNMGSAHPLVKVNIWAKIKENLSISVWLTERIWHNI